MRGDSTGAESAAKHTAGPWTYEILPYDEQERSLPKDQWTGLYIGLLDDETGRVWRTLFEGGFTHGPDDGDPEADARLISAAPDLYEALLDARAIIACAAPEHDLALQRIEAALAKAEGRS